MELISPSDVPHDVRALAGVMGSHLGISTVANFTALCVMAGHILAGRAGIGEA